MSTDILEREAAELGQIALFCQEFVKLRRLTDRVNEVAHSSAERTSLLRAIRTEAAALMAQSEATLDDAHVRRANARFLRWVIDRTHALELEVRS